MLKWLALLLSGLLVLLALALGWLLGSEAGARFALARAVAASDGRLGITGSHGRLAGPLTLAGLSWRDPQAGIEARLREVRVDLRALALLRARVQVTSLQASGIELVLHSVPPGAAPAPAAPTQPFPLAPPL
ncbi:pathogenicity protein, partial [Gammaproteobacteria bacterium PRO6]|nr:pathogenicity protein [Gammaproteobacteria bacterium PRO6]